MLLRPLRRARRRTLRLTHLLILVSLLLTQAAMPAAGAPNGSAISSRPIAPALAQNGAAMQSAPQQRPAPGGGAAEGLEIILSEGSEAPQSALTSTVSAGKTLPDDETAALLDRLPPLQTAITDVQEFRLPAQTLPPPSPQTEIDVPFPPEADAPAPVETEAGDLEVLRFAPQGQIALAPFLQVTFNQPMVALGTLEQVDAADVPVTITPQLPGVWKWLGTKTLTFEYRGESGDSTVDRFPMATEYTVEIPEGTTSATGGALQEAVRWTFSTPPASVRITHPGAGPQSRNPLLFVGFDQLIDPQAVLNTVNVVAGGEPVEVRLAAQEEVDADPRVTSLAKQAGEGRWLAFRPVEELPGNATVNVNIGPNTPSAEGPLVTDRVQSFTFQTYGPFRVVAARCAWTWESDLCPPGSPFEIEFTNPIDSERFDPAMVTVVPEIPGMTVAVYGSALQIMGGTVGRSSYEITVRGDLPDTFGQTLGESQSFSFKTDQAYPMLTGPYQSLVTLDPTADPVFSVYSINHPRLHVRIYAVTPDDWQRWLAYQRDYWNETRPEPPGELVIEETIRTDAEGDELVQTDIDLLRALGGKQTGHVIVIVEIPKPLFGQGDTSVVQAWVQVTQLALDAFSDQDDLLAWVTRLADGAPQTGVEVALYGTPKEGVTGEDGTLPLKLGSESGYMLVATQGEDVAILPRNAWDYWGDSGWRTSFSGDELRWHIFDDRQMYRPGEEVHIKGWLRRFALRPDGDIALLGSEAGSVRYTVYDPQSNILHEGTVDLNAFDGFDFSFTLPENVNLGTAYIYFTANGVSGVDYLDASHTYQIQEFRRPEFEVTAQPEGEGPYYLGDDAVAAVSAQYYAGGALPGAEATWTVNSSPGSYTPPNWDDFTFGVWQPWWWAYDYYAEMGYSDVVYSSSGEGESTSNTLTGRTDASGKHYLRMEFVRAAEPRPYSVNAEAVVMDVNRQAWAASTNLLVHPSEYYVGLRGKTVFVEAGKPLTVEVIVTDVDGNAIAERPVQITAARQEWVWEKGNWVQRDADPQSCEVVSGNEPQPCVFTTDVGGTYKIRAEVRDDRERLNVSEITRWVSGGSGMPNRNLGREQVEIIPNQEEYAAGDVAELLVQSPFGPAHGLMTVARNGFVITQTFAITEGTATLRIPIEEAWTPNATVQVDLTGAATRLDDKGEPLADVAPRPAFATGQISLRIPPVSRTLTVTIEPEATELAPAAETAIDLVATDATGEPVEGAELAVVIVDEAVLALTGYAIPNPLVTFYRDVGSGIESVYTRDSVVLADPDAIAASMTGGRGGGGGDMAVEESMAADTVAGAAMPAAEAPAEGEMAFAPAPMATAAPAPMESAEAGKQANAADEDGTPIAVRSDFNPLAVFAPAVTTDAEGRARVEFKLPDNLTRYRVTVLAVTEKEFGKAETNLTARLPLMVRPSAPRFLNFGDRFELPVVVQNQTNEPLEVSVAITASNLQVNYMPNMDMPVGPAGQRVTVPANDRVELRFPARPLNAGTARFQVAAASGDFADAASGELPVYTPATTEAFATYGVVDEGAVVQPVSPPQGVFPQFGGLEIGTSSTALSALTDAVLYVYSYPFECSEQIAARVLSIASLHDVLTAFKAEGLPAPEVIASRMETDIKRLENLQNLDGGWPIWERGKESVPYYSIFVAHALQMARTKDFAVSDETLSRAIDHLRNIESYYPGWYSELTRRTLSSYAVYVRHLMGDTDAARARELLNEKPLQQQSLEAIGWLWQVLSGDASSAAELEAIRTHVNNSVVETAGAANFFTSYDDQEWVLLHSNRRTDAILLDALINDQPESDLIPKIVTGLLAHRTDGRWNNTQENTWVLQALDRYFNTFENVEPDFIARVWFGETYVAEHIYQGYTTDAQQTTLPTAFLLDQFNQGGEAQVETHDLTIAKEGEGRLYYRLGLTYAPTNLEIEALDRGFVVARTYEPVDDPADVIRNEDGSWTIKAGARVRIRIQMVAESRRYHVALVDPLPAGLEPINPALAVSESIPGDPTAQPYGWWWYSTWYEHQNLRDSRAEAFTSLLWDGVYEYTYVARATTPGEFAVPPAKAEEMYFPEVFGRSAGDKVIVE